MQDEFEGASYIAALDRQSTATWTIFTLGLVATLAWVWCLVVLMRG